MERSPKALLQYAPQRSSLRILGAPRLGAVGVGGSSANEPALKGKVMVKRKSEYSALEWSLLFPEQRYAAQQLENDTQSAAT